MAMTFRDAVEAFRAEELKEVADIVLDNPKLRTLLAAWPRLKIERPADTDEVAADWGSLWAAVKVDEQLLVTLTGLPRNIAQPLLQRAIGLRLVYPDGSMHQLARVVLQARLKRAVQV